MTSDQLDLCRFAARIAAKKWNLERDEALSVAVVTSLEHPGWWKEHSPSWIRQSLVSYIWAELVRKPRRIAHAEQAWYEGAVPPSSKPGLGRRCARPGHVRNEKRCVTCHSAHNKRYALRKKACESRLEEAERSVVTGGPGGRWDTSSVPAAATPAA